MASRFARLRALLERLVFAGLKPDAGAEKPLPGPLTVSKKLGIAGIVLFTAVLIYALVTVLRKPAEQPETSTPPPPPAEIVAPGLKIEKNKDLEVVEMDFNKSSAPKIITGTLRNRTDRRFARCEVTFDVTAKDGGQLGGVGTTLHDVAPHAEVKFRIIVPQKEAAFAMVRELRTD